MLRNVLHDATSNVLAWSSHSANVESVAEEEASADADEPPELNSNSNLAKSSDFKKNSIYRPKETHASLLTKALQIPSEPDMTGTTNATPYSRRRRSITSTISVASTADLTSDTGVSSPARSDTPSPRLPDVGFVPMSADKSHDTMGLQIVGSVPTKVMPTNQPNKADPKLAETRPDLAVQALEKKKCISFACAAAKPQNTAPKVASLPQPSVSKPVEQAPRKTCIKFACPARPAAQQTPPQHQPKMESKPVASESVSAVVTSSPSTIRKLRSPSASRSRRSSTPRRSSQSPVVVRKKKWITANSRDLQGDLCRFHEFASYEPQEAEWIREEKTLAKPKLTMNDILVKENAIRKLGKEAEEEAEQEEEDENDAEDAPEDEDNVDEDVLEEGENDLEDDMSGYGSDDDFSDGYNSDEEIGFADSDDEEADDGLDLWTTRQIGQMGLSDATTVLRPSSFGANHSDSSTYSRTHIRSKRSKQKPILNRPMTPELPDSTDFVCGTLDEDRPLEEAYITCLAARKQEKLRPIPQDIDPSFPASEPESEAEEVFKHTHESPEQLWLHGELEDLHHEQDRMGGRRKKSEHNSPTRRYHAPPPKRLHSPPPKRAHSPPPKVRGRSPRRQLDRTLPMRVKSPAPGQAVMDLPAQTGNEIAFKALASRPGLTHTKSLPKAAGIFPHLKTNRRPKAGTTTNYNHVRGAIDIVKGLEQKRQRRKAQFYQKYCNRARKGQAPVKRPQPGQGASRMKELGLIMAGKIDQGNYVLSI